MFVGTKRQAQEAVAEEAQRCGMPYVTERWLGGLLTNFVTVRKSLDRLQGAGDDGERRRGTSASPRRRWPASRRSACKLEKNLSGIKGMKTVPDAIFVIDTRKEAIAVQEARKLKIPVVGIVDTNCDPDEVDYVIPGNDDALRAIQPVRGPHGRRRDRRPRPARVARGRRRRPPTRAPRAVTRATPGAGGRRRARWRSARTTA